MKRIVALTVIVLFAIGSVAAFAAQGTAGTQKRGEENLFKIIADSFKDFKIRDEDKVKPVEKITCFQDIYDGIEQGSANAKCGTLRAPKTTK